MSTAAGKPLALDSAAYGEATGWRKHEDLIDALPYIDPLTPEDKQRVERLIEEEMKRSTKKPSDYLKEIPPFPASRLPEGSLVAKELDRLKRGEKMAQLDTVRYQLNPPPQSKRNDVGEWRRALDNAHSQLEHQQLRLMNLELQIKYGANTWRAHNQHVESVIKRYEQAVNNARREIEDTNRARKLMQMSAGQELQALESKWHAAVKKNVEIDEACQRLQRKIDAARSASSGDELENGAEAGAADERQGGQTPVEDRGAESMDAD